MASCDPRNWFPGAACAGSFASVFLAWCLTEVLYARLGRDRRRTVYDRGSYLVGMIRVHSGVAAVVTLRALGWGAVSASVQCTGVLVMALGIAVRFWAIRMLANMFGGEYHAYCRQTWRIVPGW